MKTRAILCVPLVGICGLSFAQTTSYMSFPNNETIQTTQWHQINGCACGIGTNPHLWPESFRQGMLVNPTSVTTTAGTPVTLRYDASVICNGQGIADTNGIDISQPKFAGVGILTA